MVKIFFVKIGCRCPWDMGNPLGSWSRPSFHALLGHDDDDDDGDDNDDDDDDEVDVVTFSKNG